VLKEQYEYNGTEFATQSNSCSSLGSGSSLELNQYCRLEVRAEAEAGVEVAAAEARAVALIAKTQGDPQHREQY
jgi:hypothetical protein